MTHLCSNNRFCVYGILLYGFLMHMLGRGQQWPQARIGYRCCMLRMVSTFSRTQHRRQATDTLYQCIKPRQASLL